MLRKLMRLFSKRDKQWRVTLTNEGFALWEDELLVAEVGWDDIDSIVAYKVDLLTVDTVCLEFVLRSSGERVTLPEETEHFWELVKKIKRIFPESRQDWEDSVVRPPFAHNRTLVFDRVQG